MALTQAMCTSFKVGLLNAEFDFSNATTQVFKLALYAPGAALNASTTAYTTTDEVVGAGYDAGGKEITISVHPTSSGTTAYVSFSNVSWLEATFAFRAGLIYKAGGGNPAIAVIDVGETRSFTNNECVIQFPPATATTAILRIQ